MINENIHIEAYSLEAYLNQSQDLVKRHELCKPPREAYLYFPNNKEQVEFDPKNPHKTLRRIFQNKLETYLDYEERMLKELEEEIQHYNIKYPEDELIFPWWYEKYDKLRFLQASGYKIQKTIKLISQNIGWRNKLIPPMVTPKIFEILNSGFVYIHGRDYLYRPIIIISFNYYKKYEKNYQYNDWLQAIIFIMEYIINHMTIPGQVENWNIITDIGSVSLLLIPTDVKNILNVLQANYRCRLFINFIFGMSFIMRGIFGMFKAMLDETAQRKIRFIKSNKLGEVFEIINEEQIEQRFGGKAPNVVAGSNRLFPPIFPSDNYERNKPKELISEVEYKELFLKNKLSVVNEYYNEKWTKEEENKQQSISEKIEKARNFSNINQEQILKEKKVELVGNVGEITNNFPFNHLNLFRKEIVLNEYTIITNGKSKEVNFISKLNKNRTNIKFANKVSLTPNIISSLNINKIVMNKRPSSLKVYNRKSIIDERPTNYLKMKKIELGLKTGKNIRSESIEKANLLDNKSENLYDSKSQIQIYTEKNCNIY